jgi:hypothetical protein
MEVDFDWLRKNIGHGWNKLYEYCSEKYKDDSILSMYIMGLRNPIASLLCVESDGNDKFSYIEMDLLPRDDDEEE